MPGIVDGRAGTQGGQIAVVAESRIRGAGGRAPDAGQGDDVRRRDLHAARFVQVYDFDPNAICEPVFALAAKMVIAVVAWLAVRLVRLRTVGSRIDARSVAFGGRREARAGGAGSQKLPSGIIQAFRICGMNCGTSQVNYCFYYICGGEGGIRTHGSRERSPDFESGPFGQLRHLSDAERTQKHITRMPARRPTADRFRPGQDRAASISASSLRCALASSRYALAASTMTTMMAAGASVISPWMAASDAAVCSAFAT